MPRKQPHRVRPVGLRAHQKGHAFGLVVLAMFALSSRMASSADLPGDSLIPLTSADLATGGASRGSPESFGNILLAPAVLAMDVRYDARVDGLLTSSGAWGLQAAAVDSRTGPITFGLAYRWFKDPNLPLTLAEGRGWEVEGQARENVSKADMIAFCIAGGTSNRKLTFGIDAGRWWRRAAVFGEGAGWRLGASIAGRPADILVLSVGASMALGVTGARAAEGDDDLSGGLRLQFTEELAALADARLVLPVEKAPEVSLGGEWVIQGVIPLRAGLYRDGNGRNLAVTGGLGVTSKQASLEYGILQGIPRSANHRSPFGRVQQLSLRIGF